MTQYNFSDFDPPAPVAYVTLVPQTVVEKLELTVVADQSCELAGFDGNITSAQIVRLELVFCQRIFLGQFLLIDQSWGILGRNILNQLPLLFDGPQLEWREY